LLLGFVQGLACTTASGLGSPEVAPLVAAIYASPRSSIGFTPLPRAHPMRIERRRRSSTGYDVMLHLYWPKRSETIGFVKGEQGYKWVCDQEIHVGPREHDHPDGRSKEKIIITYSVRDESADIRGRHGIQPGLLVTYIGPDETLTRESMLTLPFHGPADQAAKRMLDRLRPMIRDWKTAE